MMEDKELRVKARKRAWIGLTIILLGVGVEIALFFLMYSQLSNMTEVELKQAFPFLIGMPFVVMGGLLLHNLWQATYQESLKELKKETTPPES